MSTRQRLFADTQRLAGNIRFIHRPDSPIRLTTSFGPPDHLILVSGFVYVHHREGVHGLTLPARDSRRPTILFYAGRLFLARRTGFESLYLEKLAHHHDQLLLVVVAYFWL